MKEEYLVKFIWMLLVIYLLAIYPFPEGFSMLSNPFIALIITLIAVGTTFSSIFSEEWNETQKIINIIRNIVFILMAINLFFFPKQYFFTDTFS